MIYLDNGATSFPKPKGMANAMEECILKYCGNPGRSGHYMSMKTGEEVYNARQRLASLFNIDKAERLIFTKNATEALNLGINGILNEGDHVVTTSMEHNSVLRPLKFLERKGVTHTIVKGNSKGYVSPEAIAKHIKENTKLIVCTHASNVTGTINDIEKIGKIVAKQGKIFMVDAAQSAGSVPVDIKKMHIDLLAFPGHKGLLGPLGTGGLYADDRVDIKPLLYGGTGTDSKNRMQPRDYPEGFEAGTVNAPAIIGLGYSATFVEEFGIDRIGKFEQELIGRFEEGIGNMEFVKLYGPEPSAKTGISLFNIEGLSCEDVTTELNDKYGIAMRGGFHCAGLAHKTIGTWNEGAVRLSVGPFTTRSEIDKAIDAVYKIGKRGLT
ncbi:MAG TPA: aminotransferase class V-fold PLP-dependent enzyme [Anaerovoracaceae bacterium]|nr:aminotransferase class V-fold PLP-dependent enzyme [Anaerovoracaceae bacterium]